MSYGSGINFFGDVSWVLRFNDYIEVKPYFVDLCSSNTFYLYYNSNQSYSLDWRAYIISASSFKNISRLSGDTFMS